MPVQLGQVCYLRPQDPASRDVEASSRGSVTHLSPSLVHLRIGAMTLSFSQSEFERGWISDEEIQERGFRTVGDTLDLRLPSGIDQNWIRVGARLSFVTLQSSRGFTPTLLGGVIVGVSVNQVHIRGVENWDPLQLGTETRRLTQQEVIDQYVPFPIEVPSWLVVNGTINQVRDGRAYQVLSMDPLISSMIVTPMGEFRPVTFSMVQVTEGWYPGSSITEFRPRSPRTPIVPVATKNTAIPPWFRSGVFIRSLRKPKKSLQIIQTPFERGIAFTRRVVQFEPNVVVGDGIEEITLNYIEEDWEPVDHYGVAEFELNCPHCGKKGARNPPMEERSPIPIRAYRCEAHTWTYIADGSENDGMLKPLSRFERILDL